LHDPFCVTRSVAMNILFKTNGKAYSPLFVETCVRNFGNTYTEIVCKVINNSSDGRKIEIIN
jgi:hypothetical protein